MSLSLPYLPTLFNNISLIKFPENTLNNKITVKDYNSVKNRRTES